MLGGELPHTRVGTGVPPPSAPGVASQQRPPGATSAASTCRLRGKSGVLPPSLPVSSSASPSLAACPGAQARSREAAARRSRHRRRWLRNLLAATARPPPATLSLPPALPAAASRLSPRRACDCAPGRHAWSVEAWTTGRATFVELTRPFVAWASFRACSYGHSLNAGNDSAGPRRGGPHVPGEGTRLGVGPPTGVSGKGRSRDWAGAAAAARRPCCRRASPCRTHAGPRG